MSPRPGFAAVVILTLALGIGVNTAIFSFIYAVLLRPFPYREPDRLVRIASASYPELPDWRLSTKDTLDVAAYWPVGMSLTTSGSTQFVHLSWTTPELFSVLGVNPILGRTFKAIDDYEVVLSHDLWQTRFGSDPGILGRAIRLAEKSYTIVGVMPPDFRYPGLTDLWATLITSEGDGRLQSRSWRGLQVVGRLKPGATLAEARAKFGSQLLLLRDAEVGNVRPYLLLLLAAAGFVLLICCANVANMFLARAASREQEMAIRIFLGAPPARLIRQLLTESVLLSSLGGLIGIALSPPAVKGLLRLIPVALPFGVKVEVDSAALAFSAAASLLTGVLFGLAPALHLRRNTRPRSAADRLLVIAEVALSLVLLVGAGLMMKTFLYLRAVDPGFAQENIIVNLLASGRASPARFRRVIEKLERLPGVVSVGGANVLPYTSDASMRSEWTLMVRGESETGNPSKTPAALDPAITPGYFKAIGIPLLAGRIFTEADTPDSPAVIIINQRTADRLWPGRDPLGRQVRLGPNSPWRTVVGIVGDMKFSAFETVAGTELYLPYTQWPPGRMHLVIRSSFNPARMANAVRKAVAEVDPELPVVYVKTMPQLISESFWQRRLWGVLFATFAGLGLILAAVGIYGVMSYAVSRRTREIGIRMALGAYRRDVLASVLGEGLKLVGIGMAAGLAGASVLTRALSSLLFGVRATDSGVFTAVLLILSLVALAACYLPARRASSVDPMVALRDV